MKNELFLKNLSILVEKAKDAELKETARFLRVGLHLFILNLKEGRTSPESAYETISNCHASIVIHPFTAMAHDFFTVKSMQTVFEKERELTTIEAAEMVQTIQKELKIKNDEEPNIEQTYNLASANPRACITQGFYLLQSVKGCFQLEMMAYNALIMFMDFKDNDPEVNEKHFSIFQNNSSEQVINYLKENGHGDLYVDFSKVLYHALVDSRMFEVISVMAKPKTELAYEEDL